MKEFNENNNSNEMTENTSVESTITESTVDDTSSTSFTEGAETICGVEAAKKNTTRIIAIIVAIIVLIFGCCAGAYAAIPQFKNTVKMLINSPNEYYKWVESENTEGNVDFLSELLYGNAKEKVSSTNMKIKAEFDNAGIDKFLKENSEAIPAESGFTLPSAIDMTVKSANIDGYAIVNEQISAEDNSIASINIYNKDNKYYLQCPELSSSYICYDYMNIIEKSMENFSTNANIENEQIAKIYKSIVDKMMGNSDDELLSRNEFEDIFNRYFSVIIENVNNVELSKNIECEADGVKCNYTKLTAKFDEGTLFSALKCVLKELQNDDVLSDLVEEYTGISKDNYKNGIEQALNSIGGLEITGGDAIFLMNVYVNSKGEVVGRSIEEAEGLGKFSLGYICTNDSNNYGFSLYFEADGDRVALDGNAVENSGKFSGNVKISSTEPLDGNASNASEVNDIIGFSFENFESNGEYLKGTITFALNALGLDDLTLNFDEKDGNQICNFDLTYDGTKLASFTCESNNKEPDSITVFNNDAKIYDTQNPSDMEQYSKEADYETYMKNICKVFGIDESLAGDMDVLNSLGSSYGINNFGMDEDEFDYDEDIDVKDSYVEYDLSKIKIQYNGNDIKLPGKVDGIFDKIKFDEEKVEANGYAYGYSDNYDISASIYNPSDQEINVEDCNVYSLSIAGNEANTNEKLVVDGIGIGDDIQKVVEKYGCKLSDSKSGITELTDSNSGFGYISFTYFDDKITGISLYFDAI